MDLEELKQYLRVDGTDLDVVLLGYQVAAEEYLSGAGVAKDYSKGLYKTVVTIIVNTFLANPALAASGKGGLEGLSITLNALIAQLRM